MRRPYLTLLTTLTMIAAAGSLAATTRAAEATGEVTYTTLGQPTTNTNSLASRCAATDAQFQQNEFGNPDPGGFKTDGPTGIVIAPSGRIFVADDGGQRVLSWPDADALSSCESADQVIGNGQLEGPEAVALGSDGTLFVGDTLAHDVAIFTPNAQGQYPAAPTAVLGTPGEAGDDAQHLDYPRGVALDAAGQLLVADDDNNRVQIYQPPFTTGEAATDSIHDNADGGFEGPKAIAVSGNEVFVADYGNERVQRFDGPFDDPNTSYTASASFTGILNPVDLTVDGSGALLVTSDDQNTGAAQVAVYADAVDGDSQTAPTSTDSFDGLATPGPDNAAGEPLGIATDASGRLFWADYAGFRVLVETPVQQGGGGGGGLQVSTNLLTSDTVYVAYPKSTLAATGGTGRLTWSISGGALPPGLKLSSAGVISGTPTRTGEWFFDVAVHDAAKPAHTATAPENIDVTDMTISTDALADAAVQKAYSATLAHTGGKSPFTYTVVHGTLPPGIKLATSGKLSGTPTGVGTWDFTVQLADKGKPANFAEQDLQLSVDPISLTAAMPAGLQGKSYSGKITAVGGKGKLTYSRVGGTVPPGLKLAATGTLTGKPEVAGTFQLTVLATDTAKPANTATVTFTVTIEPMHFSTGATYTGTVAHSWVSSPKVVGGVSPYHWSLSAGTLPAGLKLNASSGKITGKAETAGDYAVTFSVTDSQKTPGPATATQNATIVVNP